MEQYVPILLDVLVVVVIISMVKSSARRGFVRTVIQFAGYLVSLGISSVASRMAAIFVYSSFVREGIVDLIARNIQNVTDQEMVMEELIAALESLPSILQSALSQAGVDLTSALYGLTGDSVGKIAAVVADTVVGPAAIGLLRTVFFVIFFSICMLFVKSFARLFRGLYRIPLLGPANALLGGMVGGLEAILVVYVAAVLVSLLQTLTGDTLPLLTQEAVARTYLFRLFFDLNGIIGILGVQ